MVKLLNLNFLCNLFIHLTKDTRTPIDKIRSRQNLMQEDCQQVSECIGGLLHCQLQEFVKSIPYFVSILLDLILYFYLQKSDIQPEEAIYICYAIAVF